MNQNPTIFNIFTIAMAGRIQKGSTVHKQLYRQIEELLLQIDDTPGDEEMLVSIIRQLVESQDAEHFGIENGRLYRERSRDYLLIASIGGFGETIAGKTIKKKYQVIQDVERRRRWLISSESPGFDPEIESIFTELNSAAILVGSNPAYILSFGVKHHGSRDQLLIILETIRATIDLKLRQNVLESQLRQARSIQLSLLPRRLRKLEGFDLAAVTFPADEVGGDVYDVQRVEPGVLSLMVADASGHGLPAALQARDVVVGLRMAQDKDEKITAMIQRLNRVIHKTGMTSRFVSLFYCELENTGTLNYVNCGHCPPLLFTTNEKVFELPSNGPVLGPLPRANFSRSFVHLRPGEFLVIFSDGVTERQAPGQDMDDCIEPQEFGRENVIRICRENRSQSSRQIIDKLVTAVRDFGDKEPLDDDMTIMVIKRLPSHKHKPANSTVQIEP